MCVFGLITCRIPPVIRGVHARIQSNILVTDGRWRAEKSFCPIDIQDPPHFSDDFGSASQRWLAVTIDSEVAPR